MERPTRRNNRPAEYDYAQNGAYFVTICTKNRKPLLLAFRADDNRSHGTPVLSDIGKMVDREIGRIHECYQGVDIDKYVVMPNHIHMIVMLQNDDNRGRPQVAPTVSRIVQQFKGAVTKQAGFAFWQKSFHDRIIRSEAEYRDIWQYIDTNALKWSLDRHHTDRYPFFP